MLWTYLVSFLRIKKDLESSRYLHLIFFICRLLLGREAPGRLREADSRCFLRKSDALCSQVGSTMCCNNVF